jgi:hypothetical protein
VNDFALDVFRDADVVGVSVLLPVEEDDVARSGDIGVVLPE